MFDKEGRRVKNERDDPIVRTLKTKWQLDSTDITTIKALRTPWLYWFNWDSPPLTPSFGGGGKIPYFEVLIIRQCSPPKGRSPTATQIDGLIKLSMQFRQNTPRISQLLLWECFITSTSMSQWLTTETEKKEQWKQLAPDITGYSTLEMSK